MIFTGNIDRPNGEKLASDIRGKILYDATKLKYYGFLEKLDLSGGSDTTMRDALQKYRGKWYSVDYLHMIGSEPSLSSTPRIIRQILQSYIALIIDIQNNGITWLRTILSKSPLLTLTGSGTQKDDMMIYPVTLSHTGVIALADTLLIQYSGSGLLDEEKQQIAESLSGVQFSGVFSVSMRDPAYSTLSGTWIVGKNNPTQVLIWFLKDETHLNFTTVSGSVDSLLRKTKNGGFQYTLDVSDAGKPLRVLNLDMGKNGDQHHFSAKFQPIDESSGGILEADWTTKKTGDFSLYIASLDQKDFFRANAHIADGMISTLSGVLIAQEQIPNQVLHFSYNRNKNDDFEGKIELPKNITVNLHGRAKKEDFSLEAIVQGMTLALENKKIKDDTWKWSLRLPVGQMRWDALIEGDILRGLRLDAVSPALRFNTDMTRAEDDWIRGSYSMWSNEEEISSGTLSLMKKPKYFGFWYRTASWSLSEKNSFLEFVSMVDIRWDKGAKVDIPTDAEPIDLRSIQQSLSQSFTGNRSASPIIPSLSH